MGAWFDQLSGLEKAFLTCAVLGGLLFLVRLVMQFIGGHGDGAGHEIGHDVPHDLPHDLDPGAVGEHAGLGDSDVSFKLLTFQGIMAFLMIFGLVGLAMEGTTEVEDLVTLAVGGQARPAHKVKKGEQNAEKNTTTRNLDIKQLQNRLKEMGAYLPNI